MVVFLNNEFLPIEHAKLHISDLAIQRGYGIFDFFRVQEHIPLYLDDYLDRFYNSAAYMGLQGLIPRAELKPVIHELMERNKMAEAGMKMILTGGYSPDAYLPVQANLMITQHALTMPTEAQLSSGIKIITHAYRRDLPTAKTINYTMGVWLQKKVKEAGAADVLYHLDGEISEFPRCNFFLVTADARLVTPDKNILHGITRKMILQAARREFEVEERTVSLNDLQGATEVFLTSTTKRILPIVQVDNIRVGDGKPGSITQRLMKLLAEVEKQEIEKALHSQPK